MFSSQGLSLVYETINICNNLGNGKKDQDYNPDDLNGEKTIKYLKNCERVLQRINSIHPGSLGLHSFPYFYSVRGSHKIASYYAVLAFVYIAIMDNLINGCTIEETINNIIFRDDFSYLSTAIENEEVKSKVFSRDTKSMAFIQESLKNANRCSICKGFLHRNSITIDHKIRKRDSG